MQINPVIKKELKTKMRGFRFIVLMMVYMGLLLGILALYFIVNDNLYYYGAFDFAPQTAVNGYILLAFVQLILILLVVPILTGGALCGEREKQTLDLLLCSSFSPYRVILGKIISSIAHILLLIIISMPVMSVVLLYGGINIMDLLLLFVFYIFTAFMISSVGVFFSSVFKKTVTAIVMTYIVNFIICFLNFIALLLFAFFMDRASISYYTPDFWHITGFLFANPGYAFISLMSGVFGSGDLNSLVLYSGRTPAFYIEPWIIYMIFCTVVTVLFVFFASRRYKKLK